jgi:hypothetical protein
MKRLTVAAAVAAMILCLVSCMRDDTLMYGAVSMGTVRNGQIVTDEGLTLVVAENPCEGDLRAERRVHVIYDVLRKKGPALYEIGLLRIVNVLVKDAVNLSESDPDELGDDPVSVSSAWEGGGYINLLVGLSVLKDSEVKHLVNLVLDDEAPTDTLRFTLRHNAFGEYMGSPTVSSKDLSIVSTYVSFPVFGLIPVGINEIPIKISWNWHDNAEDGSLIEETRTYSAKGILRRY